MYTTNPYHWNQIAPKGKKKKKLKKEEKGRLMIALLWKVMLARMNMKIILTLFYNNYSIGCDGVAAADLAEETEE